MTRAEAITVVQNELKRIGSNLNLSDSQRDQLKTWMESTHEKIEEYMKTNPSKAQVIEKVKSLRGQGRAALERFLTPEQLRTWDAEIAKTREFLGHKLE